MNEWQPIETAPRDETYILVFNGDNIGEGTEEKQIGVASKSPYEKHDYDGVEMWHAQDCCDQMTFYAPTHWMPLPEPPKEKQNA